MSVDAVSPAAYEAMPPDAPLPMPVQSLGVGSLQAHTPPSAPPGMGWRRLYMLGGTAALTALATWQMWRVLRVAGLGVLEAVLLLLFVFLFAWIAQSFLGALAGFVLLLSRRPAGLGINPQAPLPPLSVRTALVMPTYNEDPHRLMSGLQAIYESVRDTGHLDRFDFFILSDTTRADIAAQEITEFHALVARTGGQSRLFYRRRADNHERKAGNIAEWVRRFGGAYPAMLILDADSLMTGDTIVRLAAAIERHDDVA